jgi:aspartate/methionine/tyrosine aminotransferase
MVSKRAQEITPFIAMDVMERAHAMEREGIDVVHLEVGDPDFDTPVCIKEAAQRALREGKTHYTHSMGLVELREAIADYYHQKYGVTVSPEQIVVTLGTSPALWMLFSALLESGEEVVVSDPYYSCYPNFIRFVGGVPVFVNVYEEDGFQYREQAIRGKISPKTKAILVNSPSNPTGNLFSPERLSAIANIGPYVISDEIYHGLVYEGKEHSILEFTDHAFVLNGFSKQFAMTGWRLGYIIAPPHFIRPLQKIHQNFCISASSISQWAGIAALKYAAQDVAHMREIYNQRRVRMIERLRGMGFGITVEPTGAFYVLANAKSLSNDSYKLAFEILEKAHVGVTPGISFGSNAEGYLRFSYASAIERIEEGLDRLERYIRHQ